MTPGRLDWGWNVYCVHWGSGQDHRWSRWRCWRQRTTILIKRKDKRFWAGANQFWTQLPDWRGFWVLIIYFFIWDSSFVIFSICVNAERVWGKIGEFIFWKIYSQRIVWTDDALWFGRLLTWFSKWKHHHIICRGWRKFKILIQNVMRTSWIWCGYWLGVGELDDWSAIILNEYTTFSIAVNYSSKLLSFFGASLTHGKTL